MKPNTNFKLSVKELALIEEALRLLPPSREVQELLGHLHNQKHWYRPSKETYVGG